MNRNCKRLLAAMCCISLLTACNNPQTQTSQTSSSTDSIKLTFAYLTDVHLNQTNYGHCNEGLRQALECAKQQQAEMLLFGGDNAETDQLGNDETTADSLHAHFKRTVEEYGLPAHFTIGNHDRFYVFNGQKDTLGFKMFEKHYGKSYGSFDYKGIHFIRLNGMHPTKQAFATIDQEQITWLKEDLAKTGLETPIIVSTHVPLLSLYYPVVEGSMQARDMIENTKEIVDLLKPYNIKLILQGHQHIYEQIQERGLWFVTAGGVSANWWTGPLADTEEGFLLIKVDNTNNFSWEYIDYGWDVH